MDIISKLPENIANQIAAGEVIQRPSSVVKEMMENSIDAGADNIEVNIKDSGKTYIQVIDNGIGMSPNDVLMSVERHATSKIKKAEDLFLIKTMGFRGEAMSSISSIAHVEILSNQKEGELGTKTIIEGSNFISQEEFNCKKGTSIKIKNLFYNVPARRNFLKSDKVENKHIIEEFKRIALSYPSIKLKLILNDVSYLNLNVSNLRQRIVNITGNKSNEKLVPIAEETSLIKLDGFVGKPEIAKISRGEQYFFVNGRFIKNYYLSHAIRKAFKNLISEKHHPSFFIYLIIDPSKIDINIHPTKTEVKFEDEKAIYSIIHACIKKSLAQYNIAPSIDFDIETAFEIPSFKEGNVISEPKIKLDKNYNPFEVKENPKESLSFLSDLDGLQTEIDNLKADKNKYNLFQIKKTYLIAESNEGIVIINQERAHNRIIYERFINYNQLSHMSQKLLFPSKFDLTSNESFLLSEMRKELLNLGFEISINKNQLEVISVPLECVNENIEELFKTILLINEDMESIDENINHNICKAMANKLCIKNGRELKIEEMNDIFNKLMKCDNSSIDPNGNTTFINLGLKEIIKKFK